MHCVQLVLVGPDADLRQLSCCTSARVVVPEDRGADRPDPFGQRRPHCFAFPAQQPKAFRDSGFGRPSGNGRLCQFLCHLRSSVWVAVPLVRYGQLRAELYLRGVQVERKPPSASQIQHGRRLDQEKTDFMGQANPQLAASQQPDVQHLAFRS